MVLQGVKVSTLGFENLIDMYKEDLDFKDIYDALKIHLPRIEDSGYIICCRKDYYSRIVNCVFQGVQ